MVRGLYTAWTGMAAEQKRLDIVTNNLANASTIGFKKSSVTNQSFDNVLATKINDQSNGVFSNNIGRMSLGVKLGEEFTNYSQGPLRETGNSLDFAIEGQGFFSISLSNPDRLDETYYTRASSFTLSADGRIVDTEGNFLLGQNGPITIPDSSRAISVSTEGIIYVDDQVIDRILITDFENYETLEKVGDTMFSRGEGSIETTSNHFIHQGFTEQSNVSVVKEMVDMITVTRAYEANNKVIQTIDGTLDLAANSVGRI